jgi:hypothetical protein
VIIGRNGLIERKAVATDGVTVAVMETWDTTAKDTPFCAWPRGSVLPNPYQRKIYMHRAEAEALGLLPRTN